MNVKSIGILIAAALALLSCSRAPSRTEVVKSYETAVNSADIDSLLSLFAVNAVVEVVGMGGPLRGREEIRAKAKYDSALHVDLALTVLETRKDTVFCQALEANDWTREAGLPPHDYSSYWLAIRAGEITRIRAELSETAITGVNEVMARVIPWAQENRPGALDSLMAGGEFDIGAESANLMMALLREWRAAGGGG
jgi:ketosteroid isomerase-like protein